MTEENPNPWPQTPEGVTDWESVFEDSKMGFIALIRSAQSAETLKDCATIVVQQLFSRDDDAMTVMKFILDLEEVMPDPNGAPSTSEELEDTRDAVTGFLRKIKEDRILKAAEYLEKSGKGKERRSA